MHYSAALPQLYRSLPQPEHFKEESELAGQTRVGGVYLLLSKGEVVYVGQSGHIRRRIMQHRADRPRGFDACVFYPLDDLSSRLSVEGILILGLCPPLNHGLNLGLSKGKIWAIQWRRAK